MPPINLLNKCEKMKSHRRISMIIFLSTIVATFTVNAQENVVEVLSGNLNDAEKLAAAYLEPFGKSLGSSLNNGWFNSAKPHGLFGFDITFTGAVTFPPSSAKNFDVAKLNLEYWELKNPSQNTSPTVSGEKVSGPILTDKATGLSKLTLPKGSNMQFLPAPVIQVGLGLPFHTEVVGRFFPKVDFPEVGNFSSWGIGVKNEFKEFIPGFKLIPIDVSVFFGYTEFTSTFDIDKSKDQTLNFNASGFTGKLLVSKSIPVLTVYAGVGYVKSTTDVKLKGYYDIPNVGLNMKDPLALDFSNNGFNANIGIKIKLALITFHCDYSFGDYSVLNTGIGISFR